MKCSNCGNELPKNALFCDNCGHEIPYNGETSEKLFCGECGAEIKSGMEFCGECGAAIHKRSVDENYIFCGNCGAKNSDYMQRCGKCGSALHTIDNTVSPDKSHLKKYVVIIVVTALLILGVAAAFFGYILNRGSTKDDRSETNIKMTATQEPLNGKEQENFSIKDEDMNIAKLETYYAVNCDKSISLRESPDSSATVLKEIPLGDPVSYVEPAQNGFAKIIYNGTTGYALQSYLSNNPADIKRPDKNNTSVGGSSANNKSTNSSLANNQATSGAVIHPTYNTYTDSKYKFTCSYPAHFIEIYNNDPFARCSYKASDNTATLNICGTNNSSNLSVETVQNNFKSSYPGTIDYENSGNDWCVCRTYKDGIYHYGYFKIKDGMIRGFELHFDSDNYTVYDGYVNDIYRSLNFDLK